MSTFISTLWPQAADYDLLPSRVFKNGNGRFEGVGS